MEENPFPDLKISSSDFMDQTEGRQTCPRCGRSRKYYCYTCYVPVKGLEEKLPRVKLPLRVDIIKHPNECDGKSTAVHAAILAQENVMIHTFPSIPHYEHKDRVLLVYPSESSATFEELLETHPKSFEAHHDEKGDTSASEKICDKKEISETVSIVREGAFSLCQKRDPQSPENKLSTAKRPLDDSEDICVGTSGEVSCCKKQPKLEKEERIPFDTVVFIDSTWNQVKKIAQDDRLSGLQRIELKSQVTKFWRHQRDKPDTYLATIEAIYYFFREFHCHYISTDYQGQYDNLLFLFCFMYGKIKHLYDGGKELKAYKKHQHTPHS